MVGRCLFRAVLPARPRATAMLLLQNRLSLHCPPFCSRSRGRASLHSASPHSTPRARASPHSASPHPTALKRGLQILPGATARSAGRVRPVPSLLSLGYHTTPGRRRDSAPLLLQTAPAEPAAGRGSLQRLTAAGQRFAPRLHVHGERICVARHKLQITAL